MCRISVYLFILHTKWAESSEDDKRWEKMAFLVSPITWQMLIIELPAETRDLVPTPTSMADMGR